MQSNEQGVPPVGAQTRYCGLWHKVVGNRAYYWDGIEWVRSSKDVAEVRCTITAHGMSVKPDSYTDYRKNF